MNPLDLLFPKQEAIPAELAPTPRRAKRLIVANTSKQGTPESAERLREVTPGGDIRGTGYVQPLY